jgi:hypothetical protein
VGFIPTLTAAGHFLYFSSAAARAGINPAPTVDERSNMLIIKVVTTQLFHQNRDLCIIEK